MLVGLHRLVGVERLGGNAGAHDIDAVEPGLARDALGLATINEPRLADLDLEMFGHLVLADDRADGAADLGGAAQGTTPGANARGDASEVALGRRQQSLALARALLRQQRVAADDQPFAGKLFGRSEE